MTDLPSSGSDGGGRPTPMPLAEYLVLDIVPVAEDDSCCLADAHIVRVSDLGKKTDHHKKMVVRTNLGCFLKPGDYALGYDHPGTVILVPSSQGLPTQPSSPQQQQQGILLNDQQPRQRSISNLQKDLNQRLVCLHKIEQELLGSLPPGHQGAILMLKQTRQHLARLLSSSLQREMDPRLQGLGSLLQAHNAIEQKTSIQALQEVSSSNLPVVGSSEDRSKWGYLLKI